MYLDFVDQRIYFGSNRGFGIVSMPVTDYESEIKPFCVNALSFLAVVEAVPILDVIGIGNGKVKGYAFQHESGDSFQISQSDLEDFNYPKFDADFSDAIVLDKELIPAIRRAGIFTSSDGAKNLDGIFIRNSHIYGMDKYRMYEEDLRDSKYGDLSIPRNVWEILVLEILNEPKMKIDENCIWVISEDITLQFPVNLELSLPEEVGSDGFKEKYKHLHSVKLDKSIFSGMIQFFLPFVSNVVQQRIQFIFNESNFEIKTEDGNIISRHIPYSENIDTSYFNSQKIWVSALWVKNILSCLSNVKDAVVNIIVDFDKAPVTFSIVGDETINIVYSRIKNNI